MCFAAAAAPAALGAIEAGTGLAATTAAASSLSTFQMATLAMSALGTGMSAYGMFQQGQASNTAAEANAKVMENNARMAEIEAASIEEAGQKEKAQHWLKVKNLIGGQRSELAGGNLAVDQGTALTVQEQTAALGEADAQTLDQNIKQDAWAKRASATNYQGQASALRAGRSSPLLPAAGSLLSGAGKVADRWYTYSK